MRVNGYRRWLITSVAALALLASVLALLLAGCGAAGAIGGGAPSAKQTPSPTMPAPCAGVAASAPAPSVTLRNADSNHTASAPVGSLVAIRMDGQHVWRLNSVTPSDVLAPTGAQGALEQGDCVWEFQVARSGDVVVTFIGTALCPPNAMCPQYAMVAKFTVHGA